MRGAPRRTDLLLLTAVLTLLIPEGGDVSAQPLAPGRHDLFIRSGSDSLDAALFVPSVPPPDSLGFPAMLFVHGFGQTKHADTLSASLWAGSGYVALCYSVRGHGMSGGTSGIMGERERTDLAAVIRFLRTLPGVDSSRVGVQGGSQGGLHVLWCAADRLSVAAGTADVITPRWASDMTANGSFRSTLLFLLNNGAVRYAPVADSLRSFLRSDDYARFRSLLASGRDVDTTALYGSSLPIASFSKWQDHYFGTEGMAEWFRRSAGPRRFYGGTGGHFSDHVLGELQYQWGIVNRWHDRFVRGRANGVEAEPPLTISASSLPRSADGTFTWVRTEMQGWPAGGIGPYRLYLRGDSLLTPNRPRGTSDSVALRNAWNGTYGFDSAWADRFAGPRFEAALPRGSFRYLTLPLQRDVLWLGAPRLVGNVHSTHDRFPLHCHIYEVEPAGERHFINRIPLTVRGWTPGSTGEVTASGMMHAHHFTAGNRIMVELTNIDAESRPGWGTMPFHLPLFKSTGVVIFTDSSRSSFIEIPLDADPVLRTVVADLRAEFDPGRRRVRVSWRTDGEADNGGFWILRRRPEGTEETSGFLLPQGGPNSSVPLSYLFDDSTAGEGTWAYRVRQVSRSGEYTETPDVTVKVILSSAGAAVAHSFRLEQNFPNPFNPSTTVAFALPGSQLTAMKVYDLTGREVATLVDGVLPAGPHAVVWDAAGFPSGTYFCRLTTPAGTAVRRMLLLR